MKRLPLADRVSDMGAYLVGGVIVLAAAAYPIYLAVLSGEWWAILVALVIVGVGAAAMLLAVD